MFSCGSDDRRINILAWYSTNWEFGCINCEIKNSKKEMNIMTTKHIKT